VPRLLLVFVRPFADAKDVVGSALTDCARQIMPIALNNIGWKTYMVNGAWDIIVVVLIVG